MKENKSNERHSRNGGGGMVSTAAAAGISSLIMVG